MENGETKVFSRGILCFDITKICKGCLVLVDEFPEKMIFDLVIFIFP